LLPKREAHSKNTLLQKREAQSNCHIQNHIRDHARPWLRKGKYLNPFIRDIFTKKETNAKVRKMVVGIHVIADLERT
jgi:hypothetical protein